MTFILAENDVEQAKKNFLAQWAHVNCGGAPLAYVGGGTQLGCTNCKWRSLVLDGKKPLGEVIHNYRSQFESLLVAGQKF